MILSQDSNTLSIDCHFFQVVQALLRKLVLLRRLNKPYIESSSSSTCNSSDVACTSGLARPCDQFVRQSYEHGFSAGQRPTASTKVHTPRGPYELGRRPAIRLLLLYYHRSIGERRLCVDLCVSHGKLARPSWHYRPGRNTATWPAQRRKYVHSLAGKLRKRL